MGVIQSMIMPGQPTQRSTSWPAFRHVYMLTSAAHPAGWAVVNEGRLLSCQLVHNVHSAANSRKYIIRWAQRRAALIATKEMTLLQSSAEDLQMKVLSILRTDALCRHENCGKWCRWTLYDAHIRQCSGCDLT